MAKSAAPYQPGSLTLSPALRRELRTAEIVWVPSNILANASLTPGAKFLYSILLNYSWKSPVINPPHKTLARDIGASVRATRNYIDELAHAKLVTCQVRPGKPSLYSVHTAR